MYRNLVRIANHARRDPKMTPEELICQSFDVDVKEPKKVIIELEVPTYHDSLLVYSDHTPEEWKRIKYNGEKDSLPITLDGHDGKHSEWIRRFDDFDFDDENLIVMQPSLYKALSSARWEDLFPSGQGYFDSEDESSDAGESDDEISGRSDAGEDDEETVTHRDKRVKSDCV